MVIRVEKLIFEPEEGNPAEFYVLEQTMLGGIPYILVTEEEEGDGEALILKDISKPGEEEAVYEIVDFMIHHMESRSLHDFLFQFLQ